MQTMRIELQGNSLKSAYQKGMKKGLNWQPGKFQTEEEARRPRMAAATPAQLRDAAAGAALSQKGTASSGARYVTTVADPLAAKTAVQDIELAKLHRNKFNPGSAPIPQARISAVVYEAPLPGKRTAARGAQAKAAKRAKSGADAAVGAAKSDDDEEMMVDLEDDDLMTSADQDQIAAEEVMRLVQGQGTTAGNGTAGTTTAPAAAAVGGSARSNLGGASAHGQLNKAVDPARQRMVDMIRKSQACSNTTNTTGAGNRGFKPKVPEFLAAPLRHREHQTQQRGVEEREEEKHRDEEEEEDEVARKHHQAARAAVRRGVSTTSSLQNTTSSRGAAPRIIIAPLGNTSKLLVSAKGRSTKPQLKPPVSGFAAAFGSVIAEMEQVQASNPAAQGSLYKDAVADEDNDRLFATMDLLERKDEMAKKMDSVKTLDVSAWKCNACDCTTEYRPPACHAAHPQELKKVQAVKRWWQCNGCKKRFHTVGQRYPRGRCPKCDVAGTDFIGVSMLKPQRQFEHEAQQGKIAGRDGLLLRGTEQKWVNQ